MKRKDEKRQKQTYSRNSFKWLLISLCLISISLVTWKAVYAIQPETGSIAIFARNGSSSIPSISVSAASEATIPFSTQNSPAGNELPTEMQHVPHLVLYRNGELTAPAERTLDVTISSLETPPNGITVTLRLETQHGDPDLGGGERSRITVWQAARRIEGNRETSQAGVETSSVVASSAEVSFRIEFGEISPGDQGLIPTPTDYYRLEITVLNESKAGARPLFSANLDHAFLLESQWVATLNIPSSPNQAGPGELVVYACDMFPFQRDASSRLPRASVAGYIQNELFPQMLEAVRLQTDVWGLSWDGWVSFGASGNRERLEVALSDGETWFHGPAPERGNSTIAINANGGDNAEYDFLTDGLLSTLHHELFHNFQRAIALTSSGSGDVDGKDAAWQFFAEGMASFVPSVAQPQIQFTQSREARAYIAKAVKFVGGRGYPGELNESYAEVNPYLGAMYWRFLYEQCSGMALGAEEPAKGMGLIRRTLQVLYAKEVVDINASNGLVRAMPGIMDRVLASAEAASCPFHSYTGSLTGFARAIYSLRLEGGRCTAPGVPGGCSFYDPASLYSEPKTTLLTYTGSELTYDAENQSFPVGIKSSYGMDFIDVMLKPEVQGQPLAIEFHPGEQGGAEFHVQIVRLQKSGGGLSRQKLVQVSVWETLTGETFEAPLNLTIPAVELERYNQIGMIITRVDANEELDPAGAYTLVIKPTP